MAELFGYSVLDIGSIVEQQVIAGIQMWRFEQDRLALLRGVASGVPASDILIAQRKR